MSTEPLSPSTIERNNNTQALNEPVTPPVSRGGCALIVDFTRYGNSARYRTFGWSQPEETHVWSLGRSSGLRFPPVIDHTALVLDLAFAICKVGSLITNALIRVLVNNETVAVARAHGRSRLQCPIPAQLVAPNDPIEVRIEHDCYGRLDFADLGADDRVLGLCFYGASLYPPWFKNVSAHLLPFANDESLIELLPARLNEFDDPSERATYRSYESDDDRASSDEGWRRDKAGNTWADARTCHLEVPAPQRPGRYIARFNVAPLYIRTSLTRQRITVLLNGAIIGQFSTGTDTIFSLPLPDELIEIGGVLRFSFVCPDGLPVREIDPRLEHRTLSFILDSIVIEPIPPPHAALSRLRDDDVERISPIAVSDRFLDEPGETLMRLVEHELGIDISHIMQIFESIGENCQFGVAQQKVGVHVLGLLRFGSSPLKSLMSELESEFRSISDQNTISLERNEHGEFIVASESGLRWHTNVTDTEFDREALLADQRMRLVYLKRKFYESLRAGRKIFTISRSEPRRHRVPMPRADELSHWEEYPEPLRLSELLSLFLLINRYAVNTLLYLVPCTEVQRAGTVELISPGIMRGFVETLAITPDPQKMDHSSWMRVAVNAWLLREKSDELNLKKRTE